MKVYLEIMKMSNYCNTANVRDSKRKMQKSDFSHLCIDFLDISDLYIDLL